MGRDPIDTFFHLWAEGQKIAAAEERRARARARDAERKQRRFEREMERESRAARTFEEERVRRKREIDKQLKEAERALELAAWELQEMYVNNVCKESPEVGKRIQQLEDQLVLVPFEPKAFVLPPFDPEVAVREIVGRNADLVVRATYDFEPNLWPIWITRALAILMIVLAIYLYIDWNSYPILTQYGDRREWVLALIPGSWLILVLASNIWSASRQQDKVRRRLKIEADLKTTFEIAEFKKQRELNVAEARREHEEATAQAKAEHDTDQARRMSQARALLAGDRDQLERTIKNGFGFKFPPPQGVDIRLPPGNPKLAYISIALHAPEDLPSIIKKIDADGKLAVRPKSRRKIVEQYQRSVVGLVFRYVAEFFCVAIKHEQVVISARCNMINPGTGHPEPRVLLELSVDYATLAKLNLAQVDPVAALKQFQHRFKTDADGNVLPLD